MNLLQYHNRFKAKNFRPSTIPEVTGYMWAMQDMLRLIEQITNFSPEKRYIDSSSITRAIYETLNDLGEVTADAKQQLQTINNR